MVACRVLALFVAALVSFEAAAQTRAFPTAQGFGAFARGGRGGTVMQVTSLAGAGPGTLRACAEARGPRTCVFRVDGVITVDRAIEVRHAFVTIAGQTAPGGGVLLTNRPGARSTGAPLAILGASDVIIQHLRSRPIRAARVTSADAITVVGARRVILDHVSLAFALDENLGLEGEDITVQHSIIAEGRDPHSKGALACTSDTTLCKRITFYKNLFAHNRDRNPNIDTQRSRFDVINNVVYNPFSEFVEINNFNGYSLINIIGNTFIPGPLTGSVPPAIVFHNSVPANTGTRIYQADNATPGVLLGRGVAPLIVDRSLASISAPPTARRIAHDQVLAAAGALPRDAVDRRIVDSVRSRGGRTALAVVDSLLKSGVPAGATPYVDRDRDGMDDHWETARGLSAGTGADRNGDRDRDGYTNLEEFLTERAGRLVRSPGGA